MNHLNELRTELASKDIDALLVFSPIGIRFLSDCAITDGCLVLTASNAILITDSRYIEYVSALFPGDVICMSAEKPLTECIKTCLNHDAISNVAAEDDFLTVSAWKRMESMLGIRLSSSSGLLTQSRAVKTEEEISRIRHAQSIAEQAFDDVLPLIHPGMSERELAAELTYRMLLHGAEGNSFDPIAITGSHTSMPHGVPDDRTISPGDFVTMDFGCIKDGFCSDMTRTVAVGYATDEMRMVYDTVLNAQLAGIQAACAGVTGASIHKAASDVIDRAGYAGCFGHSFGHGVGLEIHEAPTVGPNSSEPLPAGAVVSAEPGIYIPGKFGVRIEDMIVLTEHGNRNLTNCEKKLIVL